MIDVATRQSRTVFAMPRGSEISDFTVSKDDRWICLIRSNDEGDIWLAKME
jgi:hypothetical protein